MSNSEFGDLGEIFGADKALQDEGKWVEFGSVSVLIAYAGKGNHRYEKSMEKKTRPFRRYMESDKMIMSDAMKIQLEEAVIAAYADSVVLGWKNLKNRDTGEEITYSPAECKRIMIALPAFFENIREYASNLENYQADTLEDDSKN